MCSVLYMYDEALDNLLNQRDYNANQCRYNVFLGGAFCKHFTCDLGRLTYANKFIIRGFRLNMLNKFAIQHYAPLDSMLQPDIRSAVQCYVNDIGIPRNRLILGLSLSGLLTKAIETSNNVYYAPAVTSNNKLKEIAVSYHSVCAAKRPKENVTISLAANAQMSVIRFLNDFISIESQETMENKCRFALRQGLGGVALFDSIYDDPNDDCGEGVYPLTTACANVLHR